MSRDRFRKVDGRYVAYGICDPEFQLNFEDDGCNSWYPRRRDAEARVEEIFFESGERPPIVRDLLAKGDVADLEFTDEDWR